MIDLHSHSTASDGENSPEKVIDIAISKGISALALTDHDTVDGLERAELYAKNKDILFIPGIELEAKVDKGQMHILGLFIDYKNQKFLDKINYIRTARNNRNDQFIKILNDMGFEITLEELKEISNGKTIGKPHFARIFLKKHYIETKDEMFDKYFNQPPLNEIEKSTYTPKDIIQLIKDANGIAVIAHPQTLKLPKEELIEKLKELKSYGLDGLECYHSKQTPEEMADFKQIAKELGLIYTKGSDFHGLVVKPGIELGTGRNNNIVSDEEDYILNRLLEYKETKN